MHTPMFDDGTVVLRGSDASEMSAPETEVLIKARELDLCGNLLTALPPALFVEGDSWKEVAACRNKLESVPETVGRVRCSKLQLQHNLITAIPKPPAGLQLLDLSSNVLRGSHKLDSADELRTLRLQDNGLTELQLVGAPSLASIDLSRNQLAQLPDLSRSERLGKVLAAHNRLPCLPHQLLELPHLVELDLSFNHLYVLPTFLDGLRALRRLALQHNRLSRHRL
jgi:Leucine-rich repeat (LRR) protein